jgi:hypothetical protein
MPYARGFKILKTANHPPSPDSYGGQATHVTEATMGLEKKETKRAKVVPNQVCSGIIGLLRGP